jgi:hypothetical protein
MKYAGWSIYIRGWSMEDTGTGLEWSWSLVVVVEKDDDDDGGGWDIM